MRFGDFEVILQVRSEERASGSASDEEHHSASSVSSGTTTLREKRVGRKTYAIAESDSEYIIKVVVHQNSLQRFIAKNIRIGVIVDGVDCNYWKRVDTGIVKAPDTATCTTFKGFKTGAEELRAFVFCSPKVVDPSDPHATGVASNSAGTIQVDIFECVCDEGIFMNRPKTYTVPTGSQVAPDTKFYQKPSVTTTSGRNVNKLEKFEPLVRWKNKSRLGSFVLHYHTKDVIDFLVEAREKNINLDMNTVGGSMKRSISSTTEVVDLTEDDDDEEEIVCSKKYRPHDDTSIGLDVNSEGRSDDDNDSNFGQDSHDEEGEDLEDEEDDNDEDNDNEIQHVPVVKHIPCFDITSTYDEQNVTYIRKEF
jgi:hypothetical protein